MKCRYRTKTPIRCALTQCARPRALNGRVARGTFFDGELIVMRWEGESPPPTAPTRPGWSIIPSNPCLPTLSRELGVKGDQMVTEFKTALTARRREREKKNHTEMMRCARARRVDFFFSSFLLSWWTPSFLRKYSSLTACRRTRDLLGELRRLQNVLKNTNHFSGSLGSWVDEERS